MVILLILLEIKQREIFCLHSNESSGNITGDEYPLYFLRPVVYNVYEGTLVALHFHEYLLLIIFYIETCSAFV